MWFSIDRSSMMMHDAWCIMMQSLTPCNQDQSSSFCSFFGSSFIEELRCLRSLGGKLSYQGGKSKAIWRFAIILMHSQQHWTWIERFQYVFVLSSCDHCSLHVHRNSSNSHAFNIQVHHISIISHGQASVACDPRLHCHQACQQQTLPWLPRLD